MWIVWKPRQGNIKMVQAIGFSVLMGGLFGVAMLLLNRLPKLESETYRWLLKFVVVLTVLSAALWMANVFERQHYELISTTLAWSYFGFVCFWCVTARENTLLRMLLVGSIVIGLICLAFVKMKLVSHDSGDELGFLTRKTRHRLLITCVGAFLAGVCCRLRGWRLEMIGTEPAEQSPVNMLQVLGAVAVFVPATFVLVLFHSYVTANWTDVFDWDLSVAAIGCLYGATTLAVVSLADPKSRLRLVVAVVSVVASVWAWSTCDTPRGSIYNTFEVSMRPGRWQQHAPWFLLATSWWWLLWMHLRGKGYALCRTGQSIALQPKLKHMMAGMALICVLFTMVKTRYFDQFETLIGEELLFGYAKYKDGEVTGIRFENGVIPTRVWKNLTRLKALEEISFSECLLSSDVMDEVAKLRQLKSLEFSNCGLPGATLSSIGQLTNLEELTIVQSGLANMAPGELTSLNKLAKIRKLRISSPLLLSHLEASPLEWIYVSDSEGIEPEFDAASILDVNTANLKTLRIPRLPKIIAWQGIPDPQRFPVLETLCVRLPALTDADISKLSQFPKLNDLELIGCQSGIDRLIVSDLMNRLIKLSLREVVVTAADLEKLSTTEDPLIVALTGTTGGTDMQPFVAPTLKFAEAHADVEFDLSVNRLPGVEAKDFDKKLSKEERAGRIRLPTAKQWQAISPVAGVTLELDQFLEFLRRRVHVFQNTTVKSGNRVIVTDRDVISSESLRLHGINADELTRLFATVRWYFERLDLVEPQMTPDGWRIMRGKNVEVVRLHTSTTAQELLKVLAAYFHIEGDQETFLNWAGEQEAVDHFPRLELMLNASDYTDDELQQLNDAATSVGDDHMEEPRVKLILQHK